MAEEILSKRQISLPPVFFSVHHELCLIFVQVYEIFANFLRVVSHYQYTTTVVFTLPYDSWDH